ncbi:minor tail protein [Gordonia phage BritBrat]|uniref:Tail spike-like protein n=1 Tax=Gordonia phage BritBrat TaxID=1838064 RepID=A0A166XZC5_9CAUD|nr:minor tail protein [Gordonia phage BritBrat]ANA85237.1 tail spike-like protein [Gordonia phage BritBrat]
MPTITFTVDGPSSNTGGTLTFRPRTSFADPETGDILTPEKSRRPVEYVCNTPATVELPDGPWEVGGLEHNRLFPIDVSADALLKDLIVFGLPTTAPVTTLSQAVTVWLDANVNTEVTDTLIAGAVTTPGSEAKTALDAAYAPAEIADRVAGIAVVASPAAFAGIDPTGATNSTPGLQSAVAATPQGGTLIIPAGTYQLDTSVTVTDRSITVVIEGTINSALAPFVFSASAETIYSVSALAQVTITNDTGTTQPGTQITLASGAPGWKRGDVVKLVADDLIPGARMGDGTTEARYGQYFSVQSVSGSVVVVAGTVRDAATTNVRVTRLPNRAVALRGTGGFGQIGGPITFRHLRSPQVEARAIKSSGQGFLFQGCYQYTLRGQVDDTPDNNVTFGYGVLDNCGAYADIYMTASRVRHAYTDDTPRIAAGSAEVWKYGRPFGHKVSGSATGTTNTAWDTHSSAEGIAFDAIAVDCVGGLGLRGRRHSGRVRVFRPAKASWKFFSEPNRGTDSWGHDVEIEVYDPPSGSPVGSVILNDGTGFDTAGVRETRPSRVRVRIHADGAPATALEATNATLIHDMTMMTKSGLIAPGTVLTNSALRTAAPLKLGATILASDGFSGANGNIPTGRNTDNEFGGSTLSWTASPTARLAIASNQLANGSTDGLGGIYLPVSAADIRMTVRIRAIDSTSEILHLDIRRQAASHVIDANDNAWTVVTGAGNAQLMKKVAGVWTKIGDVFSYPAESDVAIQAFGSVISLLINGDEKISVSDPAVPSGNYVGIYKTGAGNIRNPNWMKVETLSAI